MPDPIRALDRRAALQAGATLAAGGLATPIQNSLQDVLPALANQAPEPPAMRSPDQATARIVGPPPLPPLEVIALSRLTFGVRPGDREAFRALGANPPAQLQAYIDQQLDPASIDDSACDARLQAAAFTTLNKSLAQLWADHVVNNTQGWAYRILPAEETEKATFLRAVYSQRQLFELLVDFWHNHFNVYGWHYYVSPILAQYDREVIRAHALGNFRQMLEAVATSTAMLFYLDNYISQAGGFNENFARELLELHTLGAENYLGVKDPFSVPVGADGVAVGYVDNDVYEAARCFTGWRVDYSSWEPGVGESGLFLYYAPWHDRANKFFLHKYLPADQPDLKDGRDVLDLLAYHPGTARHIARKLCRRLVSDYPPESLVQSAADEFLAHKQSPDQLKQVVRVIVLSAEFQAAWGQKVRRPFEAAVAMLRAANAEFTPSDSFLWNFNNLGQPLFSRIPPDGYPDLKAAWIGTTSFLQRWRLCNQLVEGWIDGVTLDFSQQMPAERRTPIAITDYWIERLLGRPVHPLANRAELVSFVAQGRNPDYDLPADLIAERVPRLAALILMTPDFQLR